MSKLFSLDSLTEVDYEKVGLMCGIEIHQQLNCGKLFCSCPCEIVPNETLDKEVRRELRFSLGEAGEIDEAALAEFKKKKESVYRYNDKVACLVDLDEEPPGDVNRTALEAAIRIGQMLNLTFFDRVQFMRKIIVDGSVTGGFQRTAMLGSFGHLKTHFGEVSIDGVNIEEDACRILERGERHTVFSLDRQGIPLIEISTGPHVKTPQQALELAKMLGDILRSFSETKRGLGTIRQDLNVSVLKGARVEIKGAQNLKLIPEIIKGEIRRQVIHISIIDELKSRGVDCLNFNDGKIYDVSKIFKKTTSKVVLDNLEGEDCGVFAIKLFSFKGILGHEMQNSYRFATEISDRNKNRFPQIRGLFHSDELPKYGITMDEVSKVRLELGLKKEDGFILLAGERDLCKKSLKYVLEILKKLILGVTNDVRQVDPKGTLTKFLRPVSGGARMYPETDLPEIDLSENYLKGLKRKIPELYHLKIERLSKEFGLDASKIDGILSDFSEEEFREFLIGGLSGNQIYSVLFDLPKDIKRREGIEPVALDVSLLRDVLFALEEERLNKSSVYSLFVYLYKERRTTVDDLDEYLKKVGLLGEEIDDGEIEKRVREIVLKNKGAPFGALMGQAMKEFGGKVDGKKISEILKRIV